jgi:hypothetical protein
MEVRVDSLLWSVQSLVTEVRLGCSVPDPGHFGTDPDADPDPRIRTRSGTRLGWSLMLSLGSDPEAFKKNLIPHSVTYSTIHIVD